MIKNKKIWILGGILGFFGARMYYKSPFDKIYHQVSGETDVPFALIKAIARTESNHNPDAHAKTSGENSRGLMQINQGTAISLGIPPGDLDSLFNPLVNVRTGAKLLKNLLSKYSLANAISFYNYGERGTRSNIRKDGRYKNERYVSQVLGHYLLFSGLGA